MNKTVFAIVIIMLAGCTKEKGIKDPAWQTEALEIGTAICETMNRCARTNLDDSKRELKTFALQKSATASCQEEFKNSRVYLLKKYPPEVIKKSARDCFSRFNSLDCGQIGEGLFEEECRTMQKIQAGENI